MVGEELLECKRIGLKWLLLNESEQMSKYSNVL